ncbi:MAG: UvrD-helicase domain-containing protein, partial [Pseudomonadota bacterium]
PGFTVMEEGEGQALRAQFIREAAQKASTDEELKSLFSTILNAMRKEDHRDRALGQLLSAAPAHRQAEREAGGVEAWEDQLRGRFGVPDGEPAEWRQAALQGIDRPFLRELERALPELEGKHLKRAQTAVALLTLDDGQLADYFHIFADTWLNANGARPKPFKTNAKIRALLPDYVEGCEKILDALTYVVEVEVAQDRFIATRDLHRLARLIHQQYISYKEQYGLLDYDDLIAKVVTLMEETSGAWVLYKLDQGIDHLLLDEAQDTGALQWSVVDKFREEFFADASGQRRNRSFFVVGDKKQSIYSFQGADASLFDAKKQEMGEAIAAPNEFEATDLFLSFRSAQPILDVVDHLFDGTAGEGVHGAETQTHESVKPKAYGCVELWPLVPHLPIEQGNPWDLPVDTPSPDDPTRRL